MAVRQTEKDEEIVARRDKTGTRATEHGLIAKNPSYMATTSGPSKAYLLQEQDMIDEKGVIEIDFDDYDYHQDTTVVNLLLVARCISNYPDEGVAYKYIWSQTNIDEQPLTTTLQILDEEGIIDGSEQDEDDWDTEEEVFYPA